MADQVVLFSTDRPNVYLIDEIFNSVTNPTGTIIPRPNSLVLDPVNNGLLQRVISVNEVTHNSILGPVFTSLLVPPVETEDPSTIDVSLVDYGNSRFYLFYDDSEQPTKLNVDKKVIVLGDDAVSFEINKYDISLQKFIPISLYFDTDGNYSGTKIPLAVVETASNVKIPTNCHTTEDIKDEHIYFLFIYDYAGTQCGAYKLFGKKAVINNAYEDSLLIEDFIVEGTQMDSKGDFYLFPDQDPGSLVLTPWIVYNNGSKKMVSIDSSLCYLYGLEGFTAAYPGQTIDLMIKYFLAPTQQAVTAKLVTSGSHRYLVKQVKLTVKDPGTNEYAIKILTIPTYIPSIGKWILMFYLYTLGDNSVKNITPYVKVPSSYDGRLMGIDQNLVLSLKIRDVFPDAATDYVYQQPIIIRLNPYDYYERYILRDTAGDSYGVYGVDSPILPRPILYFDESKGIYFIPTTKFSNVNTFLEAFYYKIRPLYDSGWLSSPVNPSHFTIRDAATGNLLISAPIAVNNYGQSFSLVDQNETANRILGTNCIVEFLKYEQGQYTTLFGAPVDCLAGTFV